MNRKLLCILPIGLLVAGCAADAPGGASACEDYSEPKSLDDCKGNPKAPHVTLNTNTMIAEPSCVLVNPGRTIVFQLKPAAENKLGSVDIFPKKGAGKWLAGTNDSNEDFIFIKVPAKLKPGDHNFGIKTATKCVDPRVLVEAPGGGIG